MRGSDSLSRPSARPTSTPPPTRSPAVPAPRLHAAGSRAALAIARPGDEHVQDARQAREMPDQHDLALVADEPIANPFRRIGGLQSPDRGQLCGRIARALNASAVCRARSLPLCQMTSGRTPRAAPLPPVASRAHARRLTAAAARRRPSRPPPRGGPDRSSTAVAASARHAQAARRQPLAQLRQRGGDRIRVRGLRRPLAPDRRVGGDVVLHVGVEQRRVLAPFVERQRPRSRDRSLQQPPHERADDLVRVAERHAPRRPDSRRRRWRAAGPTPRAPSRRG